MFFNVFYCSNFDNVNHNQTLCEDGESHIYMTRLIIES